MVKCIVCSKCASFNIEGDKLRFCFEHKLAGMINVKTRHCEHDNCGSRPIYDIVGGKGRFCSKHKTDEMIDVTHKSCEYEGCNLQPYYNIDNKTRTTGGFVWRYAEKEPKDSSP